MKRLIICVWHESQRIPATCYGDVQRPGNYEIRVCQDAARTRNDLRAQGYDAICYHYDGSSSGGGPGV